jgi:hypothetical protein
MSINPKMYPNQDVSQPVNMTGLARRIFAIVKRVFDKDKSEPVLSKSATVLTEGVPAYTWSLGCSAGGGGMTAAYLDKQYPNLIDGEMPLDDTSMAEFTDTHGCTYKVNPAITSSEFFSDYWEEYGSLLPDPFTRPGEGSTAP